jgi:hypothetical protein
VRILALKKTIIVSIKSTREASAIEYSLSPTLEDSNEHNLLEKVKGASFGKILQDVTVRPAHDQLHNLELVYKGSSYQIKLVNVSYNIQYPDDPNQALYDLPDNCRFVAGALYNQDFPGNWEFAWVYFGDLDIDSVYIRGHYITHDEHQNGYFIAKYVSTTLVCFRF